MSNSISTPGSAAQQQAGEPVEKPLAPKWIFKLMNPIMKALLRSRLHRLVSGTLMLLTYQGRKTGKWHTNPVGYFEWDKDELMAFTSGRWWVNVRDGTPVTLLIKGQRLEAVPTVIHDREAVIQTVEEFIQRLGAKKAGMLMLGLPSDRQPTSDELRGIPPGRTFVRFKVVGRA